MSKFYGIISVFLLILACLNPKSEAQSGGESHGGTVVMCPGEPDVMLDYYHAALPSGAGAPQLEDLDSISEEQLLTLILEKLDQRWDAKAKIVDAWNRIGPVNYWILADLKRLNDSNEPYYLKSGCKPKTGAARQGEIVYRDPVTTANLSKRQLSLLRGHEAVYLVGTESGLQTSEGVLSFFREVLRKGPAKSMKLDQSLKALKLPTTNYRSLKVGTEFTEIKSGMSIRLETIAFEGGGMKLEFLYPNRYQTYSLKWMPPYDNAKFWYMCGGISPSCQIMPGQGISDDELGFEDLSMITMKLNGIRKKFFRSDRAIEESQAMQSSSSNCRNQKDPY